jgi:hypothetical protein
VRTSEVETLLIGGALDFSTPPQVATKELLSYLPNGHEVVLPGLGHTGSFFAVQPAAGSRLINTFFARGRVDASLYKPQKVDFTPAHLHGRRQDRRGHDGRPRAARCPVASLDGAAGA